MAIKKKHIKVLDLFSGCGGLSFGFEKAGYVVKYGIDNWQDALITFEQNHSGSKTFNVDLGVINVGKFLKENNISKGDIDVIVGGPPCQGFSISGKRNPSDSRNKLYISFISFLKELQPRAFVMENVPNLLSISNGKIKETILKELKGAGYNVSYQILKASDYGVPQNRRRVLFVGVKHGTFIFPNTTHGTNDVPYVSTKDALSDLPEQSASDGQSYTKEVEGHYQKWVRENSIGIFNHEVINHSDQTKKIINLVPDGGNYKNLPQELQSTRRVNIAWTRLDSRKPSCTIDTGHNHLFHYEWNRAPTARESARLQSFPDNFIFMGKSKASHLKQVGNAVPPLLAKVIAVQLLKYI